MDKNNTEHYDYSGLLYLSTEGVEEDFTGGVFDFNDSPPAQALAPTHANYRRQAEEKFTSADATSSASLSQSHPNDPAASSMTYVLPKRGRLVTFTAGSENLHRVARVLSGERMVLSLWFTCDPAFQFKGFHAGRPHENAAKRARAQRKKRRGRSNVKRTKKAATEKEDL